jgi:Cys-tRNA(Pro) deacylase
MSKSPSGLSTSARRVQEALDRIGVELDVLELPASTRTAREAAQALGCQVAQIAKSLVFRKETSKQPVLVIASGSNRVDEKLVEVQVGEKISIADADYVREETGFSIGGVPPIGHRKILETFIDEDLLTYDEIWAAAGTPHAVFRLKPHMLAKITKGKIIRITGQ